MKNFTLLILILSFIDATAQVTIESVLTQNAESGEILIVDQTILYSQGRSEDPVVGPLNFVPPHELKLNLPKDTDGRYIIDHKVRFVNCSFPDNFILANFNFQDSLIFELCSFNAHTIFRNLKSETIYSLENTHGLLIIDGITTERFILDGDEIEMLVEIKSSVFNTQLYIDIESSDLYLENNIINIPEPSVLLSDSSLFYEGRPTLNSIEVYNGASINIRGNRFNGHSPYDILSFSFPDGEDIRIINNTIKGLFQLAGKSEFLAITSNKIDYLDVLQFSFPEFNSEIEWNNISGNRLANIYSKKGGIPKGFLNPFEKEGFYKQMNFHSDWDSWLPQFYFGNSDKELLSKRHFDNLAAGYYRIYTIYKTQGRIEDANSIYVEMKDLHGKRLKALYKEDNTLRNLLKWKLSQLLKLYTEHGTQPVKAVIISFYLLIFFGLFYFLFPSEWDEFELDTKKWKNQGFKKASFIAIKHLLNSFVLSLNAFVTLGFGNIPTTGVPRYVCVIQGVIGWFLLSLFTVALINQTLF